VKATKKAGSSGNYPHLPAMQPLTVEVEEVEYKKSTYQGKETQKANIRMRVIEGPFAGDGTDKNPAGKVWGNHAMTFGKRKSGESSKLRQLVVAARPDLVAGKTDEEAEAILYDFDLDELKPTNARPGARLIVVGRYAEDDQEQEYLGPIGYSSLPVGAAINRVAPTATTSAPAEGYTISPDGLLRWKAGMVAWEAVPAAGPPMPPPLPAAPAGPPALPTNGQAAPAPEKAQVTF
jgi:hypothetical protein